VCKQPRIPSAIARTFLRSQRAFANIENRGRSIRIRRQWQDHGCIAGVFHQPRCELSRPHPARREPSTPIQEYHLGFTVRALMSRAAVKISKIGECVAWPWTHPNRSNAERVEIMAARWRMKPVDEIKTSHGPCEHAEGCHFRSIDPVQCFKGYAWYDALTLLRLSDLMCACLRKDVA